MRLTLYFRMNADSFGKGFHALIAHVLKAHVLNHLMTGRRCPPVLRPNKFHSLFLQNSFDFQKVLHLKDLNFNPEKTAPSSKLKSDRQRDRQSDYIQ